MKKEQVLARMKEDCLVAVVRAKNLEQGKRLWMQLLQAVLISLRLP